MRKKSLILGCIAVVVPLVAAIGIKTVKGSEPPGRLVVNGDGTVTDTVTKLLWQQVATTQSNSTTPAAGCAALVVGAHVAGTWRVPTVKELVSIVDYESATAPTWDTAAFSGYSSFTPGVSTVEPLVYVNFTTGAVTTSGNCCNELAIRCVQTAP